MITKAKLLDHIKTFPNEIPMEELIEKLLFVEKLENRIKSSTEGDSVSEEVIEYEAKKWSK